MVGRHSIEQPAPTRLFACPLSRRPLRHGSGTGGLVVIPLPPSLFINHVQVDMSKVKLDVLRPWMTARIIQLLGFEDDVLVDFICNQLEESTVRLVPLALCQCARGSTPISSPAHPPSPGAQREKDPAQRHGVLAC
jgi:hypothetical protein